MLIAPSLLQIHVQDDKESNLKWPTWVERITYFSHFLTVFNSSVNFYIYLFKHPTLLKLPGKAAKLNLNDQLLGM